MPENKKKQPVEPDSTIKMSANTNNVELTQKISVDYDKVVGKSEKKKTSGSKIKSEKTKKDSSAAGISLFSKKRISDDYVKSSSIISTIDSIPPLVDKLELLDVQRNYTLKNQFSEGAQGIISTAFDKSLKRDIVIKSLKADNDEGNAREDESLFVSEARIMAQLDHPSIIPLYGLHCGNENKLHLAMKHIHGKTMKKYLEDVITLYKREGIKNFDEKSSTANRIEYLIKVCEAVDYAHCKGVIHRDLKPENIMIGNYGEVYVMDWGLACLTTPEETDEKQLEGVEQHSKNALVGTPCYIAPELIRGGSCSPQSDIFSLGMILFEIVTLEKAVPGETVNEVLKNIIHCNYRSFKHRFLKGKLSPDLRAIVAKSICDSLDHRYKSGKEMIKDLRLYLMSEETVARPDNIFRKYIRAMVNHKMITSLVILSMLLCFSGLSIHSLYTKNVLMKRQEAREHMLTNFQHGVSHKANEMERIFFYFKTQLANIAYRSREILSSKASNNIRIYSLADFKNASTTPRDYAHSPAYGIGISLDEPIFKKAVKGQLLDSMDKKIVSLSSLFKHIMFTCNPAFKNKGNAVIRKIIMKKGAPLIWITIGLKNGSMFAYPGASNYTEDYDPRTRPWYNKALDNKGEILWSAPFKCMVSGKMLMSITRCIYNNKNIFQGVASLHIRLDYIQKYIFRNEASYVKEYLIDNEGQIVLSSDFKNKKAVIDKKNTKAILKKFPFYSQLQKAVKQKKVQFEATIRGEKYIFALNRIPSLGYYYVEQISEERLHKDWEKSANHN